MADTSSGRTLSLDSNDDFRDPLGANDPLGQSFEDDFEEFNINLSPETSMKLEIGNSAGSPSMPPITVLTQDDNLDNETKDLFVVVDNPEKHMTTMEAYITFRVTTKTSRGEYEGEEFQVRRRYNDFLWLRQRLEENHPVLLVPPLPEKHSLKRLDRFNQEFVKSRKLALQIFVQRLADHPVLSFNKFLITFLTAKQAEFAAAKKEGLGFMSRISDSFHNMSAAYMMKNRPDEFSSMQDYMSTLGEKLGVLDRISQRILKEQQDHLAELNEWGPIFTLWSSSEDKLSQALTATAKSLEKCYLALNELVESHESCFSLPIREYILYNEAIKGVLRRRDAIQMEYEMTLEELNRKKDERDQLSEQVEALNDKTTCSNADLKADMERWHKTKRKDFRRLFMSMADKQILYYKKYLRAWEEAIPKIQHTDIVADTEVSSQDGNTSSTQE